MVVLFAEIIARLIYDKTAVPAIISAKNLNIRI